MISLRPRRAPSSRQQGVVPADRDTPSLDIGSHGATLTMNARLPEVLPNGDLTPPPPALRPLGKTGYALDPTLTPEARAERIRQAHIGELTGALKATNDVTARDYSGVLARVPTAIPQALFAPDRETPQQRAARERANALARFASDQALENMRQTGAMARTRATQAGENRRAAVTHGDTQLGVTQKIIDDFQQERAAATGDLNRLKSEGQGTLYSTYERTPTDSLAARTARNPALADFAVRYEAAAQRLADVGDSVQTYIAKRNAMAAAKPGSAARQPAAPAPAAPAAKRPTVPVTTRIRQLKRQHPTWTAAQADAQLSSEGYAKGRDYR